MWERRELKGREQLRSAPDIESAARTALDAGSDSAAAQ
jgi:hypothetical protein